MNKYLRAHVEKFAHKTVNSAQFKEFFLAYMRDTAKVEEATLATIDWDTWYNKPGMPSVQNQFDQTLIKAATDLAELFLAGGASAENVASDATKGWDSAQSVIFLERFIAAQKDVKEDKEKLAAFAAILQTLDAKFAFSASQNCELKFRWLTVCAARRGMAWHGAAHRIATLPGERWKRGGVRVVGSLASFSSRELSNSRSSISLLTLSFSFSNLISSFFLPLSFAFSSSSCACVRV